MCCISSPNKGSRITLPTDKVVRGPCEGLDNESNWMDNLEHSIGGFSREGRATTSDGHLDFNGLALENVIDGRTVGLDPNISALACVSD